MARITVTITNPKDGDVVPVVPRVAHVAGTIGGDLGGLAGGSVTIKLGDADTVVRAATILPPPHSGQWRYDGPLPDDVPYGANLRISVRGEGDVWNASHTATISAEPDGKFVNVALDNQPLQLGNVVYEKAVEPTALPYGATITGMTAGSAAGVATVSYRFDRVPSGGGPAGVATNSSGDWRSWTINAALPDYGDYRVTIAAQAAGQRTDQFSGTLSVHRPLALGDPTLAFAPTTYVGELCDFAQKFIFIGPGDGPDRPTLAGRFRQPYDRIADPAVHAVASERVLQVRLVVEVLRRYLQAPPPAELDQRYRAAAYEALLGELGTSTDELRRVRLDSARAEAVASRLGVDPAQLPLLTFSPDTVTDENLASVFGLRPLTTTDPFGTPRPTPQLPSWQRTGLRNRWRIEDGVQRDGPSRLPIIDPDHVGISNVVTELGPAAQLWHQRQGWLDDLAGQIDQTVQHDGDTMATFDELVKTHLGSVDLAALVSRATAGENVSSDLALIALDLPGARYLAGIRDLLERGPLLPTDWREVRDVLVASRKRRQFAGWRREETTAGIVLEPDVFVADPPSPGATTVPASPWRTDRGTHEEWLRVLAVRTAQARRLDTDLAAAVTSTETAVLPGLRDALLDHLGSRHTPPETGSQAAERLGRELCLDLRVSSPRPTTRVDQAAETLQSALLELRSGSLPPGSNGAGWSLRPGFPILAGSTMETPFDLLWQWLSSYRTWYAAITSFAYPENHVYPTLWNAEVTPISSNVTAFLTALRKQPVTPALTEHLTRVHWDGVSQDDPTFFSALESLVPTRQFHTNKELAELQSSLRPLYNQPNNISSARLFDLFWLVPIAIAQALQDNGYFTEALDWYQWTYAYQLPAELRRTFPKLADEKNIQSTYERPAFWPVSDSNPHRVADNRADTYTRFTVMSIVRCLLAFADSEFTRNTTDANAQALALYRTALDLIDSPDLAPPQGPPSPFPANPVWDGLRARAQSGLDKIRQGLNIASMQFTADDDQQMLPSQYRYAVLVDRAKALTATAQQLESAFLAAVEQRDNNAYSQLQADRDLVVATALISVQDAKVASTDIGIVQAKLQGHRAAVQARHYQDLLNGGLDEYEDDQKQALAAAFEHAVMAAAHSAIPVIGGGFGGFAGIYSSASSAFSLQAQHKGLLASFERRKQEWELQAALAAVDEALAGWQIDQARSQQQIAVQERKIAGIQLSYAAATADFLATKFTNTELFEWMSGVLAGVYAYFLQQATALARLAQAQLAFERQEPTGGFIQDDYWQPPPTHRPAAAAGQPDRRGLTGSARLLEDITRLDQYAFDTDRRKLHLTQTFAVSQLAGVELQRFRETGVLTFATPEELFDREFPGHYLRLVKRVQVSLIALLPPRPRGPGDAVGLRRVPHRRRPRPFETVTLRRDPESIAFTSPINATGLFELEPETGHAAAVRRAWASTPSGSWSCPRPPTRSTTAPSPTCCSPSSTRRWTAPSTNSRSSRAWTARSPATEPSACTTTTPTSGTT